MAQTGAFTRKLGPLPIWAWGILGGIAAYFLYVRHKNSSSNAAANSPTATVLDPNAVDPTTGLTYGQELAGGIPGLAGNGTAGASSGNPAYQNDLTGPLTGFDQELQSFLQAQGDFGMLAGALGFQPPNPSANTQAAAQSAPLKNTSPPKSGAITTHKGGAFYTWYQQAFGKPPPKTLSSANWAFQAWQQGVNPGRLKQAPNHGQKTVHVAHPAPHQQPLHPPKSNAKPAPVKRPAAGGTPGRVPSGSHQRAPAPPRRPNPPTHRGGPPAKPPKRPAPRKPAPVRR